MNDLLEKQGLAKGNRVYCPLCYQRNKELIRMRKVKKTMATYKCPRCAIQLTRKLKE